MSTGNVIGIAASAYGALSSAGIIIQNTIGTTVVNFGVASTSFAGVTQVAATSFTVTNAGLYEVDLSWSHSSAVLLAQKFMGIYKNGVLVLETDCSSSLNNAANFRQLKALVNCVAGDSIGARIRSTSATAMTFSGSTMVIKK